MLLARLFPTVELSKSSIGEVDERLADHARRSAQRHVVAAE